MPRYAFPTETGGLGSAGTEGMMVGFAEICWWGLGCSIRCWLTALAGCVPPFTHSALKRAIRLMIPAVRRQLHMDPHGSNMHLSKQISRLVTYAHNHDRRPCKRWDTPEIYISHFFPRGYEKIPRT